MTVKLNSSAKSHASGLIADGKVDKTSSWSISADEENAMLGSSGDDWANYAKQHLGEDDGAAEKTKQRYKYPYGKDGKVYRSALTAIRQRAAQNGATAIFDAAGALIKEIDGETASLPGHFQILAKGEAATEILIYGDIGDSWDSESVTAAQFVRDLQNIEADTINVRINSYGGAVSDGLAIYNALKRHPAVVNVSVDGMAISIASLIAMAGDTVEMAENALMMIHAPWALAIGNAKDMRDTADILDRYAAAMATSYASKTKKSKEDMMALLADGEDHWFGAEEAVASGFADSITAAVKAQAHFDLSRYRGSSAALAALNSKGKTMPSANPAAAADPNKPANPEPAKPNLTLVEGGRTKEQIAEIKTAFAAFMKRDGVAELYTSVLEDPAISVEQARAQLLAQLGKDNEPANPQRQAAVEMGASERDKFIEAAANALLVRAHPASGKDSIGSSKLVMEIRATIGQNPYRGMKLLDLARACVERMGVDVRGMSQSEIVMAAFNPKAVRATITQTTSDFPVLLENTLNKTLQAAYATTPDTWRSFCATGSVGDFRASNRYRAGSFGNLSTVNEAGEFKYIAIPDGEKASVSAGTKGALVNVSRQTIINDDLGFLNSTAAGLGRAANRSIEVDVYALLAQNSGLGPTMSDTYTLFHANHGNISATGAIAVSVFDDARVKMASQKDVSGNDYLDLRPRTLVIPIGSGGNARVINQSQYDTEVSSKFQVPNRVVGLFQQIVDTPRLSGTRFYMFADQGIAPVIEVVFLDGNQEPFVEMQNGFEVDGVVWKVRLDYGTGVIDYRGAVTGAGA